VDFAQAELFERCEEAIGYRFRDRGLLERCLTHSSAARTRLDSNERLEFLGDAILGAIVCEVLYERLPQEPEGEMTRIKSAVVSRLICAQVSDLMGLPDCLIVGKGLQFGVAMPQSLVAAVFESILAGIYLDGGWSEACAFVRRTMGPIIEELLQTTQGRNYKSLLQQLVQKDRGETPRYVVLAESGPDHSKFFRVAAVVGDKRFAAAWGPNKKAAQQRAAENAWFALHGQEPPCDDTHPESIDQDDDDSGELFLDGAGATDSVD
jgi:ribonuclease-3